MIQFVSDLEHSTNTTDRHNIIEILLKVAFSKQQPTLFFTTTYSSLIFPFMTYHRVCSKSNATGVTHGKETVYSSGTQGFTSVRVILFFLSFSVLCCVFFICLYVCLFLFVFLWGEAGCFVCRFSVSVMLNVASGSRLFIREYLFSFL